ncbi:DUF4234 domain-containing protein [Shewanella benthica]|nr:DUF4234 domain-containing protein [Shewanella benthica]
MASVHHKYRVHRLAVKSCSHCYVRVRSRGEDLHSLFRRTAANQDRFIAEEGTDIHSADVKLARLKSTNLEKHKLIHFVLTLITFGAWGLVWWWLILKSEGKTDQLFRGFDDAYWSYLIEREQPPASLHKMKVAQEAETGHFDA